MRATKGLCAVAAMSLGALTGVLGAGVPAPRLAVASIDDVPIAVSHPYDNLGDADEDLAAAMTRARSDGKRVLIELGADWCVDCIVLANVMRIPTLASFVADHYDVVLVDVGRFNRNTAIAERYGIALRRDGVPAILILDRGGKLLNPGHTAVLVDARRLQPQAIADWLAQWAE